MLGRKYTGAETVEFECTIEKGNLNTDVDIKFPGEVSGSMRVRQFRNLVAGQYQLPGVVSLHRPDGEEFSDDWAFVGDVIATYQSVTIRFDPSVRVAHGAMAGGAWAHAGHGGTAMAGGGFATGGAFHPDGTAEGGMVIGGTGRGGYGEGGYAIGGGANNPNGKAVAGEKIGGDFFRVSHEGKPGSVKT